MEMDGSGRAAVSSRSLHAFFPSPSSPAEIEKEHMFDKTVTPSDVGKLNRLVIPKQHAERFFPLDASSNEKGLLLNFEDRDGKEWRFRYSYWNSSQSYVMTKGWSRFVKEKRLDAGDTVSFSRGVGEAARDRLFIDWKRRPADLGIPSPYGPMMSFSAARAVVPWGRLFVPPQAAATASLYDHNHRPPSCYGYSASTSPYLYHMRSSLGGAFHNRGVQFGGSSSGGDGRNNGGVYGSAPEEEHSKGGVRLFGVNLDHPPLQLSLGSANASSEAESSIGFAAKRLMQVDLKVEGRGHTLQDRIPAAELLESRGRKNALG